MRLKMLKPREVVRILKKAGFKEDRQTGSHLILVNRETRKVVPIPMHSGDIKRGLLASIVKESGLTLREFMELL
jgi:predicted RNA binding protein YcfA (HicA-like mRNA interferase family)